jgi:outer membrane protein assembly factor BamB
MLQTGLNSPPPSPPAPLPEGEGRVQLATRIAAVAGVFALVVCALLAYDYARRLVKDPLDSAAFQALVAALDQQPANDALKIQIRDLDLQLRREYFRQRAFAHVGAALLLVAVAVFLVATKTAATLHRRLPTPDALSAPQDYEAVWTRSARWAVAALGVVMLGAAIAVIVSVRSEAELPSTSGRGAGGEGSEGEDVSIAVANANRPHPNPLPQGAETAVAQTPPTDEEIAKAWPRFRGPGGLGVSAYTNVPETWDAKSGKGIKWKTPVPLPGNNSPVVWGNRVFLSGADQRRREVYCYNADSGKLLWQQVVPGTPQSTARPPKVNKDTGFAASTTSTDGRRVFAIFANGDLAAFDISGTLAWSKSLDMPENTYGHASSLATYKNLLLVQFDQGSPTRPKSKLLAFDAASGKIVWQADRPVPNSWSSPIVIRHAGSDQVVTSADPWVIAYNPADGAELWRAKCLKTDIGVSPAFADGRVFVGNDNSVLSAIRADGRGDVTGTHVLWKGEDGLPDTCSPLATKEFVLLLTSFGTLTCYDAVKGDKLWEEEFEVDFSASPSLVGNRVYLIARTGKAWIVEPSREKCKRIGQADLGEACVTSPAFQDGRIYLRGEKNLFCIGKP